MLGHFRLELVDLVISFIWVDALYSFYMQPMPKWYLLISGHHFQLFSYLGVKYTAHPMLCLKGAAFAVSFNSREAPMHLMWRLPQHHPNQQLNQTKLFQWIGFFPNQLRLDRTEFYLMKGYFHRSTSRDTELLIQN